MKTYTYDEVNAFIKELETGRNEIQNKISDLRGRRKNLKVWDFKGKQEIDKEMLVYNFYGQKKLLTKFKYYSAGFYIFLLSDFCASQQDRHQHPA